MEKQGVMQLSLGCHRGIEQRNETVEKHNVWLITYKTFWRNFSDHFSFTKGWMTWLICLSCASWTCGVLIPLSILLTSEFIVGAADRVVVLGVRQELTGISPSMDLHLVSTASAIFFVQNIHDHCVCPLLSQKSITFYFLDTIRLPHWIINSMGIHHITITQCWSCCFKLLSFKHQFLFFRPPQSFS